MTEPELKQAFEHEKPALQAWGELVKDTLISGIRRAIGSRKLNEFLKILPEPRVKDTESFLTKALRRGKNYTRPLEQITDKVGVRFVVLLRSELRIVSVEIEKTELWEWRKDKDFEAERAERPHHFDYQSVHYIVRTKRPMLAGALTIPAGMPCEVQVRTLLQHAYAELAHDRTYKSSGTIENEVLRQVAKSAALVETTDEIFVTVNDRLQAANAEIRRVRDLTATAYLRLAGFAGADDARLTNALLDPYREHLPLITKESLDAFLSGYGFIVDKIKERAPLSTLYRHPCVIAVYFLVQNEPDLVPKHWPFDMKHLEMIYSDLGLSTEGRLW